MGLLVHDGRSEDVKLGRSFAGEVDKTLPVSNDAAVNEGIARIGQRILEANGLVKDYEWQFRVIHDDATVNAFALPGGKIYVYSGLIARADDEAEVAGVLAHEITHVTHRHGAERLTDLYGVEVVESLLLGKGGTVASVAAAAVTKAGFLAYSRHQESDADSGGFAYLTKTDYDPNGMVRFFEKIEALQGKHSGVVARYTSDHPDPGSRVSATKKRLAALPPEKQKGETYKERWLAYREHVAPGVPRETP